MIKRSSNDGIQIAGAAGLTFRGRLRADEFIAFARHRAALLDLSIDVACASDEAVTLSVRGGHDLIDAFEMACSLGPYACLVLDVTRHGSRAVERRAL